jgi:tRNA threonylcarbamoyl adenosine modification protein YeaZ
MMNVLALDTASPRPTVALSAGGRLFEENLPGDRRASEELLPAVRRVLAGADVRLADCERIAVCAGPGSFTGLRVGLATAWGFGRALGIPVEAVSTLAAMAEAARSSGAARVVAVLDAGRGEFVCQRFDLGSERARSLGAASLFTPDRIAAFASGDPVVGADDDSPPAGLAASLARAVARQPLDDKDPGHPAIYSRPSAAEEKRGAP